MITCTYDTYKFYGLSTDDKNSIEGLTNGCMFIEIDTGKIYLYSEETSSWLEQTN